MRPINRRSAVWAHADMGVEAAELFEAVKEESMRR